MNGIDTKSSQKDEELNNIPTNFSMVKRVSDYSSHHDYMFRICLVGDSNVGKTSLLTRYCDNIFKESHNNTIGVDFRVITLQYNDNILSKVHIWDTAGQERFKSISVNYFRSTHGFMFVYDVTNKLSFKNLNEWIDLAFANNKSSVVNFLIGNKKDLKENRQVSEDEGKELAGVRKFTFLETSALSNENVHKSFEFFTYKLIEYYSNHKKDYDSLVKVDKLKTDDVNRTLDIPQKSKKKCAC